MSNFCEKVQKMGAWRLGILGVSPTALVTQVYNFLFYVHADNRASGVEDSREWGTVHARDFVGVILPANEESQ